MNTTLDPDAPTDEPPASTDGADTARRRRRKRIWIGVAIVAALLLAAAGAGIWWFLRDDAPPEVTLDAAIETLDDTATANDAQDAQDDTSTAGDSGEATDTDDATVGAEEEPAADAVAVDGVTGTWVVDTELGEFDYESATGSFVGFRIEEELRGVGSTTAVGRTGDVSGTIVIDATSLVEATFEVDVTTITTNDSRRDDNVWDAMEVDQFPTASFVLAEPVELGTGAADGEAIAVVASGDLTIHGVTQRVDIALEAQLVDDVVVVVGSTEMTFSDYGVDVPDGGPVISVDDFGVVELQLLFTR